MRFRNWLVLGIIVVGGMFPAEGPATATESPASTHAILTAGGFCSGGIRWKNAENFVGKRRKVRGPVMSTFFARRSNGRPTFLNVGRPFPNPQRFTVVIWGRYRHRFPSPPEKLYRDEYICAEGRIRLFEGVPEVFVSGPGAIEIRGAS